MGGDVLAGTNFVDALKIFENDPDTEGIILVGEIGGTAEMDAAEWIRDYNRRTVNPKPVMALVGGLHATPGRIMGHAGAWTAIGEPDANTKYQALERAGAVMVNHPEKFGEGMKTLLNSRPRVQNTTTRSLFIKQFQALDMLKEKSISVNESNPSESDIFLNLTVDRTALSPCVIASTAADFAPSHTGKFPFPYANTDFSSGNSPIVKSIASHLKLPDTTHEKLAELVQALWQIFKEKEAYLLEVRVNPSLEGLEVRGARFGFDDAAFRSSGRQKEVHSLRNQAEEVHEEVEAEKDGIVYVKIQGEGSIGTLGGKATSETVKSSFRIITSDARVKAIFVNIFGGLTRCDMIAEGIIMAFRDLHMSVPVVVRLRGTNEEEGQKMKHKEEVEGTQFEIRRYDKENK
ncbi:hypothetical protein APSETT445_004144 [Aspergillus pseudonomiae]